MKREIIAIMLLFSLGFLFSENIQFDAELYHSRSIIVCFSQDVIGNQQGILDYNLIDGIISTPINRLNELASTYGFSDLQQMHPIVKYKNWNDNGRYVQNIYRIKLETDDFMDAALSELKNEKYILFAEFEGITKVDFIPDDPMYSQQWHLPKIWCPEAWDWTFGSDEITIGIVDSGVLWTHPDLRDNIWINEAELNAGMTINWDNGTISGGNGIDDDGNGRVDDVIGWNFYNNNNNTYQTTSQNDHGTHVAGCAGAVGNNGLGVSGSSMVVKLMVSRHTGVTPETSIYNGYDGILYCTDSGADIINCSWGGPGGSGYANTIVNYARNHGAQVVGAAGNENTNNNVTPHYPSDATYCISVASTDQNDVKTYFSNYGSGINVSCPGIDIKSTIIAANGYGSYQGTSMSSPIVAGTLALMLATHPDKITEDSTGPDWLTQMVMFTCDDISEENPAYNGMLGYGRINAFQAVMHDLIPHLTIDSYLFTEVIGDGIGDDDGLPNPGEVCDIELLITNNMMDFWMWKEAFDIEVTITTDNPDVTIISGTESQSIPVLYAGNSEWCGLFQISTLGETCIYNLDFTFNITANQESDFPYESNVDVTLDMCLVQNGWPYTVNGTSTSSGIISDIDGNPGKEVIFGDQNGNLHVVNSDGTPFANFPVNLGSNISSAVAVGDLTGDGFKEIVVADEGGYINAVNYQGTTILSYNAGGIFKGNPIIADVDGNGTMEIVATTFSGNLAVVLNSDGSEFENFPVTIPSGGTLASPAVGDLDGDGNLEIIVASLSGAINAISTATGENIANWPYATGTNTWKGPIVSNIDSDDDPEVLVATGNGKIVAINHDGTLVFERDTGEQIKTSVITGDLDSNGTQEIICISTDGNVYVLDNQGNDFGNFPSDMNVTVESSPILADLEGNGTANIIFGDNTGFLHALDLTGNDIDNFPIYLGSSNKVGPAIGDTDGDGDPEILIPNQNAYILIDFKKNVPDSRIQWAAFKRNARRTGNSFDPATGIDDNDLIPVFADFLAQNYPNPFNPDTNISFSLQEEGIIRLDVFNMKGQLVRSLVNEELPAGNHMVNWNGKDNDNKAVGSGIYLYKLNSKKFNSVKKMLLIK